MVSLDTIFITLTLLILSSILIKIRASRVIIPLGLIYVFFILNKFSIANDHAHPKDEEEKNKADLVQPQSNLQQDESSQNNLMQKSKIDEIKKIQEVKVNQKKIDKELINKKEKEKKTKIEKTQPEIKNDDPKKISNEIKAKKLFNDLLTLKEIKICRNIKSRNPVGIGEVFPSSVDSLYCFTKIENLGKKMEVRHVWYYENQIMTQVRYNVKKSNVYRSWTKKTISSFQIGNWRVEVQDRNGTIIGTKRFKIKKSS